ncbi:membrane protein [Pseudomonas sp. LFM046]|uniref:COG3650 family protein n=1 Tax=Pseudomonas sp. LFM046 TaxID=1608357 RepID=UPI0005CFBC8B|nr:membrane protein [Pseudomonas sp. LFM046]
MRLARPLLFSLLPLFGACQMFAEKAPAPAANLVRLQGQLSVDAGQVMFSPCGEKRRFALVDSGATGLLPEAANLSADGPGPLFADVRASMGPSTLPGVDGQLDLHTLYRLQREGHGCTDLNFKRLLLQANGHEPDWSLNVSGKGLVLDRPGQPSLALPYVEEQLPEGRFNLSSEANGQRLELWVAPQRCVDSMSGAVQHLSAELRLDGKPMRGCASFGGARDN